MKMQKIFINRLQAIICKEFIEMRRDRTTFAMIIGVPLIQLILFGYAINTNPRYLPTAITNFDHSYLSMRIVKALENSTYFNFIGPEVSESESKKLLKQGDVQFVINFPVNFTHDL